MADLHVFEDDHDTWIAESVEDALKQSRELYEDWWDDSSFDGFGEMRQLPDDEALTISSDDSDREADGFMLEEHTTETGRKYRIWRKTMTCAEWAAEGPGHLGGDDG